MSDDSPQCPRCRTGLVEELHAQRRFLSCAECGGCFAPIDTIAHFRDDARHLHQELPDEPPRPPIDRGGEPVVPAKVASCPQCDAPMSSRLCYFGSEVTVDTCRDHGVWFDATELRKTVAALDEAALQEEEVAEAKATPAADEQKTQPAGFVTRLLERAFG